MREKLRTWWKQSALKGWADGKLPLSRGKKLVLNLAVIVLAGLWLWGLADYEAVCWDMGGGVWLAGAFREDQVRPDRAASGTYTLRLYDQAGELLLEREGAVPQPL